MYNVLYTILVLFVIGFIIWQLYIIKKYNFGYPVIRINRNKSEINVDKNHIKYNDIKAIKITDLEQPSLLERTLSRGAAYVHISQIEFYLKNNTLIQVKCNSKGVVNQIIKELSSGTEVIYDRYPDSNNKLHPINIAFVLMLFLLIYLIFVITMTH